MKNKFSAFSVVASHVLLLAMLPAAIHPNDCSPWPAEKAIATSELIFSGRIKAIGESHQTAGQVYLTTSLLFEVDRVWKGRAHHYITLWTQPNWEWYLYETMECKKMSTLAPDGKTSIVNLKDCLTVQNPPETRYLIYAWKGRLRLEGEKRRKVFLVSMCSRSDLLSARAEDLVLLGPGHLPKK